MIAFQFRWYGSLRSVIPPFAGIHTIRHSRESGNPRVAGVNVGYPSRPPDSERYRLLPLAKLIEHVYYYIHMTHRSPCHSDQNHKATKATRCLMPENQKKTPCSKLTKRNPDSKPNSDTTARNGRQWPENRSFRTHLPHSDTTSASDDQIQRPDMSGNGREIEISELTFRTRTLHPPPTIRYNGPICPEMAGKSKFPNSPSALGHYIRLSTT